MSDTGRSSRSRTMSPARARVRRSSVRRARTGSQGHRHNRSRAAPPGHRPRATRRASFNESDRPEQPEDAAGVTQNADRSARRKADMAGPRSLVALPASDARPRRSIAGALRPVRHGRSSGPDTNTCSKPRRGAGWSARVTRARCWPTSRWGNALSHGSRAGSSQLTRLHPHRTSSGTP